MREIFKTLCEKFELVPEKVTSLTVNFEGGVTTAEAQFVHIENEEVPNTPSEFAKLRDQYNAGNITFNEYQSLTHKLQLEAE